MSEQKRIAVIGAGIAGLACAYVLKKSGYHVDVYEKNGYVGGRMSSRTKDGFIFDLGADHLCDLYDRIKYYSNEFGIAWEKMRFLKYALVKDGKLLPFADAIGLLSKLRLTWQFFLAKNVGDFLHLDQLAKNDTDNAFDYMRRWVGKTVADYYVDAFTSTYQFHRAKEISVGALKGILKSIGTNPKRWYLHRTNGGMQALPNAFAERLDVRMNTAVTEIIAGDQVLLRDSSGEQQSYDAAVLASTAGVSKRIYQNPTAAQTELLHRTEYATSVSVAFRVKRDRLPDIAVVWVPYVENQAISGFVNEAMKGEELVRGDTTLLCAWLHEEFAKTIIHKSDEEIFAAVKRELLNVCPWVATEEDLVNHDLERWPEAMPKFSHGHLERIAAFMQNGQGENNVFFCGDFMNGPWTEGALRNGERVAEQVIQALG